MAKIPHEFLVGNKLNKVWAFSPVGVGTRALSYSSDNGYMG
jgi:hypothetical protein